MEQNPSQTHSGWYRYGVIFIVIEAGIAVLQTIYALYMVLSGAGGLGGGH
jgi:hypothetical protein